MSIADELALLANTKESLRVAIGLSTSIPFSQYAVNIPWGSDVIPATGIVFDFSSNRYAKDGKAVYLDDISEFIRLSAATMWQDGKLVEVANNVPRISGDGLLIEPQRTNYSPRSVWSTRDGAIYEPSPREPLFSGQDIIRVVHSDDHNSRVERSVAAFNNLTRPITSSSYVISEVEGYVHYGFGGNTDNLSDHPVGNTWSRAVGVVQDGDVVSSYEKYLALQAGKSLTFDATCNQLEENTTKPSSFIPTTGTPVSRSPDILNIPLLPSQTITGDWDAGVTYTVDGGIATFTGHGYIRNITVEAL